MSKEYVNKKQLIDLLRNAVHQKRLTVNDFHIILKIIKIIETIDIDEGEEVVK